MIYIWYYSKSYANRLIGIYEYETERSPSYLDFITGEKINKPLLKPHNRFKSNKSDLQKYDVIYDNSLIPIVNQKVRDILNELCPDDVQFIDGVMECNDGLLEGYQYINVTYKEHVIDHRYTTYTSLPGKIEILGFTHLVFKPNSLKGHGLARDAEFLPHVLVSEHVRAAFHKNKVKGVSLLTAEEFNKI